MSALVGVLNPVLQLAATPFLFHRVGAASYGIWILIVSVVAASGLATLGLGEAATKYSGGLSRQERSTGALRLIRSIWTLYLVLGFLAAALLWAAAPLLSETIFRAEAGEIAEVVKVLRISAFGVFLRFLYGVAEAALRGHERYDVESTWAMVNSTGTTLLAVLCVSLGGGLASLVISSVAVTGFTALGLACSLCRLLRSARWMAPLFHAGSLKEVFGFGVYTWLQCVNGVVSQQVDRFVIASWLGVSAAGYYSACLQVVLTTNGILSRACAFVFPLAAKYREQGNSAALLALFQKGMILSTSIGWIFSSVFIIFGGDFLRLWMGAEFAMNSTAVLQTLAVWNAFLASSIIPFYFLNATGHQKLNTLFGVISTATFVFSALVLIPRAGLMGAALARLCTIAPSLVTRSILIRTLQPKAIWFGGLYMLLPTIVATSVAILSLAHFVPDGIPLFSYKLLLAGVSALACFLASSQIYKWLLSSCKPQTVGQTVVAQM